jgi:hypothetical protein
MFIPPQWDSDLALPRVGITGFQVSPTSPCSARTRTAGGELPGHVALARSSALLLPVGTLPGEAANVCFVPSDVPMALRQGTVGHGLRTERDFTVD